MVSISFDWLSTQLKVESRFSFYMRMSIVIMIHNMQCYPSRILCPVRPCVPCIPASSVFQTTNGIDIANKYNQQSIFDWQSVLYLLHLKILMTWTLLATMASRHPLAEMQEKLMNMAQEANCSAVPETSMKWLLWSLFKYFVRTKLPTLVIPQHITIIMHISHNMQHLQHSDTTCNICNDGTKVATHPSMFSS